MRKQDLSAADRLIFALDVGTEEEARALVNELKNTVGFFKVGLQLFIATGHNVVKWLVDQDLNVFLDLKIYDIGETVRRSVEEVSRLG
ncbi:MAG: orotidine 5'-phosphate decarboxylase / HUMPS family protein, partial [Acidobacteriota bacterium]